MKLIFSDGSNITQLLMLLLIFGFLMTLLYYFDVKNFTNSEFVRENRFARKDVFV